jgi:hypothetical protein
MKSHNLFIAGSALFLILCSSRAAAVVTDTVLPLAAYANFRHDIFGNSYTNLYGTAELYANLNSVNDDRAVIEFPTYQIPAGSTIQSATLAIYVWAGGGNTGDVGTFHLYGYTGDGIASMADYYDQQVLLKSFTESVPPTYGYTYFDVTSFIQAENSSQSLYSGFLFQALSQNVLMGFGSPGPNSFPWPTLDVKYTTVPEPGVAALILVAATLSHRRVRR